MAPLHEQLHPCSDASALPATRLPGYVRSVHGSPATRGVMAGLVASLRSAGLASGSTLAVACSGGADSVALTRALAELRGRRGFGFGLRVSHVDHGLRPGSDADAAWVVRLAASLRLESDVTRVRCDGPGNLEQRARERRYAALAAAAARHGAAAVLTAHTADDQLETLLMRLVRGAGPKGMAGMPAERALGGGVRLVRPLLGVGRRALRAFLAERGSGFVHDPTNDDATRLRARLRRDVLPVLRDVQPGVAGHAAALAEDLQQAHEALAWAAKNVRFPLARWEARALPAAVVDAALARELDAAGVPAGRRSRARRRAMVRACRDGGGAVRVFELGPVQLRVQREEVLLVG